MNTSITLCRRCIVSYSIDNWRRCRRSKHGVICPTRSSPEKWGSAYGLGAWRSKQLPDWSLFCNSCLGSCSNNFGALQGWRTQALEALALVVWIYISQAAVVHHLELKISKQTRDGSSLASAAFTIYMPELGINPQFTWNWVIPKSIQANFFVLFSIHPVAKGGILSWTNSKVLPGKLAQIPQRKTNLVAIDT